MIASAVPPSVKLPTIRQLANDLWLAKNTVARAYRDWSGRSGLPGHEAEPRSPTIAAVDPCGGHEHAREAARSTATTRALGLSMRIPSQCFEAARSSTVLRWPRPGAVRG
jgi:DNA-binding transcriptional MocR family regulator